jgi:hypothetical protein
LELHVQSDKRFVHVLCPHLISSMNEILGQGTKMRNAAFAASAPAR